MSIVECVAFYVSPLSLPWHLSPPHPPHWKRTIFVKLLATRWKTIGNHTILFRDVLFYFLQPQFAARLLCARTNAFVMSHIFSLTAELSCVCVCVCGTLSHHWVIVVLSCLLFNMFFVVFGSLFLTWSEISFMWLTIHSTTNFSHIRMVVVRCAQF